MNPDSLCRFSDVCLGAFSDSVEVHLAHIQLQSRNAEESMPPSINGHREPAVLRLGRNPILEEPCVLLKGPC